MESSLAACARAFTRTTKQEGGSGNREDNGVQGDSVSMHVKQ